MKNKFNKNFKVKSKHFCNNAIRAHKVFLVDDDGKTLLSFNDAYKIAQDKELDLVQFTNDETPICKILDYNKYLFDLSKKEKALKKKQKESSIKIKEIKFRPSTGLGDLKVKALNVSKMLEDGCKVKVIITFRGRELAFKGIGYETLSKFVEMIPGFELESEPSFLGKQLTVIGYKK